MCIRDSIMDTYFFCRCLIPPDHGDRDISVQHLDIIKVDIINLSFGKLFRISAEQNLNIEQFLDVYKRQPLPLWRWQVSL